MQLSSSPTKFPVPFGNNAVYTNVIPQNPTGSAAASLQTGFPLVNFTPAGAGGFPNHLQDFNGLLNQATAWDQWMNVGGTIPFDSAFSSTIGGYPQGALLASATTPGNLWLSLIDNNTQNPDTASLLPIPNGTLYTPSVSGGVTVTAPQWLAIPGIITTNVSYTVGGPTVDLHGIPIAAGQFNDLNTALTWLSQFRITDTGSVTFILQGVGAYGPSAYGVGGSPLPYIIIDHPNANRIIIQGLPTVPWYIYANNITVPPATAQFPYYLTPTQRNNINSFADLFNANKITFYPSLSLPTNYTSQQLQSVQVAFYFALTAIMGAGYALGGGAGGSIVFSPIPANSNYTQYGFIVKTPGVTLRNLLIVGSSIATSTPLINQTILDIQANTYTQNVGVTSAAYNQGSNFNGVGITIRGGSTLTVQGSGAYLASICCGWNKSTLSPPSTLYPDILIEDGGSLTYGADGSGLLLTDGTLQTGNQNIVAGWSMFNGIEVRGNASLGPVINAVLNANILVQGCSTGFTNPLISVANTGGVYIAQGGSFDTNNNDSINISYNAGNGIYVENGQFNGSGVILNYNGLISGSFAVNATEAAAVAIPSASGGSGSNPGTNSNTVIAQIGSFIDASATNSTLTTSPTANTVGNSRAYVEQS